MNDDSFKKKLIITFIIAIILFLIAGVISYRKFIENKENNKYFEMTQKSFMNLYINYKKELPKDNLELTKIDKIKKNIAMIKNHDDKKQEYLNKITNLKKYYLIKEKIGNIYKDGVLLSNVNEQEINNIDKEINLLPKNYQSYLLENMEDIKTQKIYIQTVENEINKLFNDSEKTTLKEDITLDNINSIKNKVAFLKQTDLIEKSNEYLDNATIIIKAREEAARKQREEEIRNAWVVLDVPYISQNQNNVLNGCEAASLLMGLQYKGYLQNVNLQTYATNMPKSETNAYEGFTHDIFGLEPTNIPHWIAPAPLANYGRVSSGANVVDGTGKSLDELDNEIINNNPVVIYATAKFNNPKEWIEGAPKNIHVQLLVGYNKITKEQIVIDPWTHSDGRTRWTLSKKKLEYIYNAVGKKSVIIK